MRSVLQEAVDVWSLLVMSFELLVGQPALRMHEGEEKVRNLPDVTVGRCDPVFGVLSAYMWWNMCSVRTVTSEYSKQHVCLRSDISGAFMILCSRSFFFCPCT